MRASSSILESSLGHGLVYTAPRFNFKMGNSSLKNTRESIVEDSVVSGVTG